MSASEQSGYLGEGVNEYGTPISLFRCWRCGENFSLCPAIAPERRMRLAQQGCGAAECDTYDPACDANVLFGDRTMFLAWCERKGIDPATASALLPKGDVE